MTVPVLSSTTVSMRRADSSTSGPRIRMPSCAPRPVPTSSAIGVARPSAHGQAMISTATAFAKATSAAAPAEEPADQRGERQHDHDGHEHRGDAVGEALGGGLAGLGLLDEAGDAREGGVGADPRRLDHQASARVERRAGDGLPGCHLDRHALAGQQRAVDRREALANDAVGRDQLAGPHDEAVAGAQLGQRHAPLDAVREHGDILDARVREVAKRATGLTLRALLEVPAEEDEQRHSGRDLEVQVLGHAGRDERHHRPAERGCDAERDQRVHRDGAMAQAAPRRAVDRPAAPQDGGQRQRQRRPSRGRWSAGPTPWSTR